MEVKTSLKNLRISARKARLVANLVRHLPLEEALLALKFSPKRTAGPMLKVIRAGIADAKHNFKLPKEELEIQDLRVDEGKTLKRVRFASRGRVHPIRKRTSQISLILVPKAKSAESGEVKSQKEKGKS